jgi:hypothetical protein
LTVFPSTVPNGDFSIVSVEAAAIPKLAAATAAIAKLLDAGLTFMLPPDKIEDNGKFNDP